MCTTALSLYDVVTWSITPSFLCAFAHEYSAQHSVQFAILASRAKEKLRLVLIFILIHSMIADEETISTEESIDINTVWSFNKEIDIDIDIDTVWSFNKEIDFDIDTIWSFNKESRRVNFRGIVFSFLSFCFCLSPLNKLFRRQQSVCWKV